MTESSSHRVSETREEALERLQVRIGYSFADQAILNQALTHRSFLYDRPEAGDHLLLRDYESLEFLGDAVLSLIISEFLYRSYPDLREGDLSKIRSHFVSARQLSRCSAELGLGEFLILSRGEEKTGGRSKRAILADLFESLLAAIYLDGGLKAAREFVLWRFNSQFQKLERQEIALRDHKSALQEHLHQSVSASPTYRVLEETGPDHRKEFRVAVISEGQVLGVGTGKSKKEAEQRAAESALEQMVPGD
jgi:ribonuclease-3